MKKYPHPNRGLSMIETIIAVAIMGLIVVASTTFQRDVFYLRSFVGGSLATAQDARYILRTMTRELRAATQGSNGAYPLSVTATSSVTFFSDIDTDDQKEQIRYFLTGTTLHKGVINPTGNPLTYNSANEVRTILASNVQNSSTSPLFEYFGTTYDGTTAPFSLPIPVTEVRLIKINLKLDSDINRSPVVRVYTSQASLRNLKDNL